MLNNNKLLILLNVCLTAHTFPQTDSCGKSLISSQSEWRIVGGTDAAVGEFPWQTILTLAIENKTYADANNFCGATLINERWILTAAHCVDGTTEKSLKVRLGVHNFKIIEKDQEFDVLVEKVIPHQKYDIINDIALIKLNQSLDLSAKHKHLRPICLATNKTKLTRCVATGFGFINTHRQRPVNGLLQKVDEPFADKSVCKKLFVLFNENQNICAGGSPTGGKSVCNCDSGGPLQCEGEDGRWYQVGIVAYGKPCALPGVPDVFTKVSAYIDWIDSTISSN